MALTAPAGWALGANGVLTYTGASATAIVLAHASIGTSIAAAFPAFAIDFSGDLIGQAIASAAALEAGDSASRNQVALFGTFPLMTIRQVSLVNGSTLQPVAALDYPAGGEDVELNSFSMAVLIVG
jgi:hypothetical protein